MSDYNEPSCSYSRRDAIRGSKPSPVKHQNFGQSILDLNVAEHYSSTLNRSLTIDQNVARIPCTEKKDYVRKWLETQDDARDVSDDLSQSSPILTTAVIKVSRRSPILGGNNSKRRREKVCINRCTEECVATTKHGGNMDGPGITEYSAHFCMTHTRSRSNYESEEKNEQQNSANRSQWTPPHIEKPIADMSPVLGTRPSSYKKIRRKLHYELENCNSQKRLKQDDDKTRNINRDLVTEFDQNLHPVRETFVDTLQENLDTKVNVNRLSATEIKDSSERLQIYAQACLPVTEARFSFEDSSSTNSNKDNSKLEIDTSDDSKCEEPNKLSSVNSNSSHDLSNFIEEVDTQDMLATTKPSQPSIPASFVLTSRQSSKLLHTDTDNSNETYCSEAEMAQDQSTHLSAKVSQMPSSNQEATGGKSTQTDAIISSLTSPSKMSLDESNACLLDSGKKRRKPKKGSMVAKMQSLINGQVSAIRIWRHRMNKKQDATSVQFITVLVHSCWKHFGNQFLNGTIIEDRYNLLQNDAGIQESALYDDRIQSRSVLQKNITIMLVCSIVGTLKMQSEVVINIYPPWDILDKIDLTLEAMYINILHNYEIPDVMRKNTSHKCEKRIVKEFNCPCIEEDRAFPFCAGKPNSDKPNVIEQIFDF